MKYLLPLFLISIGIGARAQVSTTLYSPEETQLEIYNVSNVLTSPEILDSLAIKALDNSNLIKAIDEEVHMYEEEVLQNKRSWLNSFRLGINMFSANTTLDAGRDESITTYGVLPSVGLNLTVNPEVLVNRKSKVRASAHKQKYSEFIRENTKQTIKKDILNLYHDYLSMLETINVRRKGLNGRKQHVEFLESSFRNGEATYDQILIATNQVHLAEEALITASISAAKKKMEIEVLLGIK